MNTVREDPVVTQALIRRVADGGHIEESDQVAVEAPVAFVYNCRNHAVMMATPVDLEDFAWGFSIAEGIVRKAEEVLCVRTGPKGPGYALSIEIPPERAAAIAERARNLEGRTGCGLCGIADIDRVLRPLPECRETEPVRLAILLEALHMLPSAQVLNQGSGALHAAAFASPDGHLLFVREDVGRHNALDKMIGAVARKGVDPESGFVVVTSRCSMEMVQKVATFGCPILIAISAPTSLAIELAERSNLTVAAFARGARLNLYTHPGRII